MCLRLVLWLTICAMHRLYSFFGCSTGMGPLLGATGAFIPGGLSPSETMCYRDQENNPGGEVPDRVGICMCDIRYQQ